MRSESKYMPHYGAKEAARYAGRTSLGPNASRVLQVKPVAAEPPAAQAAEPPVKPKRKRVKKEVSA